MKEGLQVRALLMKLECLTLEYGPVIVMYDPLWSWTDKKSFPRGETRFTQQFSNMSALHALAFSYSLMLLFRIFPLTFDILVIISTPYRGVQMLTSRFIITKESLLAHRKSC